MLLAIITLISALFISSVAAFFSVTGLAALFAASYKSVLIMGVSIEIGKIVAASWLKENWANKTVSWLHKFYLTTALIIAMSITSLGVFGFLSKSHFEQNAPIQGDLVKIEAIKEQLAYKKQELDTAYKQLDQLNKSIIPGQSQPSLERERRNLQNYIQKLNNEIQQLTTDAEKSKIVVGTNDVQLGPVKYLAGLLFKDPQANMDHAVQIIIVMIMLVFDPLALTLVISSQISFKQARELRELKKSKEIVISTKIEKVIPNIEPTIDIVNKEVPKEMLIVKQEQPIEKSIIIEETIKENADNSADVQEIDIEIKPTDDDSKGKRMSKFQTPDNWSN